MLDLPDTSHSKKAHFRGIDAPKRPYRVLKPIRFKDGLERKVFIISLGLSKGCEQFFPTLAAW